MNPLRIAACALGTLTAQLSAQVNQEPEIKKPDAAAEALDRALAELDAARKPTAPIDPQNVAVQPPAHENEVFKLYDLSLNALFAGGGSTVSDERLGELFGGGHDPRKRGFTIQNVELAMSGAVDPYFRADLNLVSFIEPLSGETIVELEEAYLTTTSLPGHLEVQAGQFLTRFGRINPEHPHQWDFLDAPVIRTRILGPDGMRGPGLRVGWLAPLPWFSEFHAGVQNANGETMSSFLASEEFFAERAVGGRPFVDRAVRSAADLAWSARWVNAFEPQQDTTVQVGISGLHGPNATGVNTSTAVFGTDLVVRWADDVGGRQGRELVWQSEFMWRRYEAGGFTDLGDPTNPADDLSFAGETLRDHGFYSQAKWRLSGEWSIGLRLDVAGGSGSLYDAGARALVSRGMDPFRGDRRRITPLLEWSLTHFSRLRLQYSYDQAAFLDDDDAHSIWIGGEVGIGAHAAHSF